MKISEIIEKLEAWHPPLMNPNRTADTVKCGNPEEECTGVAVTCFASVDVIRQAAAKGINFIICHEPLFFGDQERCPELEGDPVYEEKSRLLKESGIVVWRDHDHIHGPGGPGAEVHPEIDYIYYGIMKELGWEDYVIGETTKPLQYEIPRTTVRELAREFMEKFRLTGLRVVGNLDAEVRKVFVCEHITGRPGDLRAIRNAADYDVMIPLEIVDWTLSEYVRDAAQLGKGKAILEMGHFNTEELGMKYMTKWLPKVIGAEVPVTFLPSGDSFSYLLRE